MIMVSESKMSQRDETLIKVLDRLSDNIQNQELLLDEIKKRQLELSVDMERTGLWQHSQHEETGASLEKTRETFLRYRSDMLRLVNEQDRMNDIVMDLKKKQAAVVYAQDNITRGLLDLNARMETQEKSMRELNAFSVQQGEKSSREIADANRSVTKLHMDTDKRLGEEHRETHRRLDEIKRDTIRRLMTLDKIEASLDVLLIRTEPPEKKPFFVIRIFRWVRGVYKRHKLKRIGL